MLEKLWELKKLLQPRDQPDSRGIIFNRSVLGKDVHNSLEKIKDLSVESINNLMSEGYLVVPFAGKIEDVKHLSMRGEGLISPFYCNQVLRDDGFYFFAEDISYSVLNSAVFSTKQPNSLLDPLETISSLVRGIIIIIIFLSFSKKN